MYTLNCGGKLLVIDQPIVMGILNTTPDSFFTGSRVNSGEAIIQQASGMLADGAAILDVGGQSTRPGAGMVGAGEEMQRIIPAIKAITSRFPGVIISVDTFHAAVAEAAVQAGATMVNDISGGQFDPEMLATVAKLGVPYICMHNKGTPETMHQAARYDDLLKEILDFFIERTAACKEAGIKDVIIDPGFGFAKNISHNFRLLQNLPVFKMLEKPLLLGLSRKSTIYKTLGITANEALNGTTVLNTIGLMKGADILRVHDVREAVEAIKLVKEIRPGEDFNSEE